MAKHASTTSRVPRKVVLGLVLAVALMIGLVSARAVGAIGGDEDRTAAPAAADPAETPTAEDGDTGLDDVEVDQDGEDDAGEDDTTPRPERRDRADKGKGDTGAPRVVRRSQRTDQSQRDLASAVEDLLEQPDVGPTAFRVASFNVLGHSHTTGGGNKPGYAPGPTRMRMAVQVLRNYGAELVGFQEFEPIQNASFQRIAGGQYGTYPGMRLGRSGVRRTIAWRTDTFELLRAATVPTPYFRGNRVPMPYVLLEHKETGQRVWAINVHNPTSNAKRGNNARWRAVGMQIQTNLVNRLHRETGYPVILMGDFNERAQAFCTVTGRAPMRASAGGSTGGGCRPPGDLGIDWIFGTTDMEFTRHVRTRSGLVARASDHPIVVADALVTPDE